MVPTVDATVTQETYRSIDLLHCSNDVMGQEEKSALCASQAQ